MLHHFGGEGKPVNADWHATRAEAREETFSLLEWDEIDITRYDLEEDGVSIITGKDNDRTYEVKTENGDVVDIREQPEIGP